MPRIFKEEGTWVKGGRNKNARVSCLKVNVFLQGKTAWNSCEEKREREKKIYLNVGKGCTILSVVSVEAGMMHLMFSNNGENKTILSH